MSSCLSELDKAAGELILSETVPDVGPAHRDFVLTGTLCLADAVAWALFGPDRVSLCHNLGQSRELVDGDLGLIELQLNCAFGRTGRPG